jgi:hypothetical protein
MQMCHYGIVKDVKAVFFNGLASPAILEYNELLHIVFFKTENLQ